MEFEQNLHGIADPAFRIADGRRTLVFAASVAQAERLAEILNRHRPGCAAWLCGKTERDARRKVLGEFAAGALRFVCNVGVLTEGFDDAGVEVVVMARPTKSRALYAQMAGRATRPSGEVAGALNGAADDAARRAMIAASRKPGCLIVDFVGNAGRHKLVCTADILGGRADGEAAAAAAKRAREAGRPVEMAGEIARAQAEIEERRKREAARRAALAARAEFTATAVDPFDVLDISPAQARGPERDRPLTRKQRELLLRQRIDPDSLPPGRARQVLDELFRRWDGGLATFGQARILKRNGFEAPMRREEAEKAIERIARRQGWAAKGA